MISGEKTTDFTESVIMAEELKNESSASCMITRFCVVGQQNHDNQELRNAVKTLDVELVYSDDGRDVADSSCMSDAVEVVFLCEPFEGDAFDYLWKEEHRIVGPPIVFSCASDRQPLPCSSRPLYCTAMSNLVVCFTGFKEKSKLSKLCALVHFMGGSVRRDFNGRVTHLVANSVHGDKYRAAVGLGTCIMTEEWIHKCWDMRSSLTWRADNDEMMDHKLPPFFDCCLTFVGFSEEEKAHMEETTIEQGGTFCSLEDKIFTHVVVENCVEELPPEAMELSLGSNVKIVKQEWFWASIQVDACADTALYLFKQANAEPPRSSGTPSSSKKSRKRRRMKETDIMELLSPNSPCHSAKRKSGDILSVSSFSGSLLDVTMASPGTPREDLFATPSGQMTPLHATPSKVISPLKPKTARHQVALELLQTERNYVDILNTILKVFKMPLEQEDQRAGPILAPEEIKTIFASLPDILEVHHKMMMELEKMLSSWTEDKCIGNVILKHADVLMKVYPVFVNFFEMSKETVVKCDRERPRFHAFLKICLGKPECGRQTLSELLIRPVQRLPSMNLLLTDLLKQTKKADSNNPDVVPLGKAIEALKTVMTHINEYKRKTDSQVQMFEIIQDIDNCPPNILSSHRSCVAKMDGFELSDVFCGKTQPVTLFLFSDSLEVTKRRSGVSKSSSAHFPMKSPAGKTPQRAYKHLEFIPLSQLRKVVDIKETEENHDLFGFMYRSSDMIERFAMLRLVPDEITKEEWLEKLVTGLANATSIANRDDCITTLDASTLTITKSDLALTNQSKIGRAVRVAKKTTKKVSRAFSMNKTPRSKVNVVKRSNSNVSPGGMSLNCGSPLQPSTRENLRSRLLGTRDEPTGKELRSNYKAMSQYMSSPSLLPGKT